MSTAQANEESTMTTWEISAFHKSDYDQGTKEYTHHLNQPSHLRIRADFANKAEAEVAIAAIFPKSVRASAHTTSHGGDTPDTGGVQVHVTLTPNGNNGGINEAGLKRYRSARKALAKAGVETTWYTGEDCCNAYHSEETFEAGIA